MTFYGTAGGGLEATFGRDGKAGAVGERRLEKALIAGGFDTDPETHVFFGLRADKADIDCVVVRGRVVVCLDAKLHAAAERSEKSHENGLAFGAEYLKKRLPGDAAKRLKARLVWTNTSAAVPKGFGGDSPVLLLDQVLDELADLLPAPGTAAARPQPRILNRVKKLLPKEKKASDPKSFGAIVPPQWRRIAAEACAVLAALVVLGVTPNVSLSAGSSAPPAIPAPSVTAPPVTTRIPEATRPALSIPTTSTTSTTVPALPDPTVEMVLASPLGRDVDLELHVPAEHITYGWTQVSFDHAAPVPPGWEVTVTVCGQPWQRGDVAWSCPAFRNLGTQPLEVAAFAVSSSPEWVNGVYLFISADPPENTPPAPGAASSVTVRVHQP